MKKVIYLSNIPSPYRVSFFNLITDFFDLTVVFDRHFASDRNQKWLSNSKINFNVIFLKGIKYRNDKLISLSIIKLLRKNKYDLYILGGYSTPTCILAAIYLKLHKKHFVINADGGFIRKDNLLKRWFKKMLIGSADYWLSTGPLTTKYLAHYGASIDYVHEYHFSSISSRKIINPEQKKEYQTSLKEKYQIKDKKVILFVGQIIHRKGIDTLLSVASLAKMYHFIFIGGQPTAIYKKQITDLKLNNVEFIDFISEDKYLKEYFILADIFVLPTREDIWGLVINEAMSYSLPVITTSKCIAGLELLNEYCIVPPNNVNDLFIKIKEIASSDTLYTNLMNLNYSKIKTYTIEKMVNDHVTILNKIIEEII